MQAAIDQFHRNIERARNLGALSQVLNVQTAPALDLSDLLRSELALAVSALDHYIHELVRLGMLESLRGQRTRTDAFLRFPVTLSGALDAVDAPGPGNWLERQIIARHGYRSFQDPDRIADAIRLISNAQLWNEVAERLGASSHDVRANLRVVVDRRNKIAHEADVDSIYTGRLRPIDFPMVDDAATFIERLAEAIHAVAA